MRRKWLWVSLSLTALFTAGLLLGRKLIYPDGHIRGEILTGGVKRHYLLYVPGSYNPSIPTPLVISIHGFASWPQNQMEVSRWNRLADQHGFLVVYPSGTGFPKRWNTGGITGSDIKPEVEVAFITNLIDTLSSQYHLDPARIYANGLSNGGGMSHLLACRLSQRIAAIGTVAGAYVDPPEGCHPTRPMPVIAFHGTADPIVPYLGGVVSRTGYRLPVIAEWVKGWAQRNGCALQAETLPDVGEVSGVRYAGCSQAAEVVFYTVNGGGHTWPGGMPLPEFITGKTTQDVDATALMWAFYQKHPLK